MKAINEFLDEGKVGAIDITQKDLQKITSRTMDNLITANAGDPVLFRHGTSLVWIESDNDGRPAFREISLHRMRSLLARKFSWHRVNRQGDRFSAYPPLEVAHDVLAFPNIDLPVVERIVSVPVFAADGTLQLEAGYNAQTRSIFIPPDGQDYPLPVSDEPDKEEVNAALSLFHELVHDFPFVDYGKTHTLAALLVPFVRALIKGPTPLHLFEKPEPGTGATLLVQAICDILLGHSVASITEAHHPDEFSRKVHSALRPGPSVVFLDNLKAHVDNAALVVALTNDTFADRIVQRSEVEAVPIRCLWLGAANNPSLSREMARRTIPIRLDAKMPNPHLRTEFLHANLREWVAEARAALVWALLTLVRAWIAAGRPKGTKNLGMYESYSQVIGGILDVAGVPGFLDIPQEIAELGDDGVIDLSALIPKWQEKFKFDPVGVAQLLSLWSDLGFSPQTEGSANIRLGKLLRANRGRQVGDVVITPAGERGGSKLWCLVPVHASDPISLATKVFPNGEVGELGESYTHSTRE